MNNELRDPKALKKLGELKSAGNSWVEIKNILESEMGIKTSVPTIQSAYNIYISRSSEIITGDEELKNSLKEAVLDTATQLKEVNNMMRDILKQARTLTSDKISASKEILNQLYFQEKLLNRI